MQPTPKPNNTQPIHEQVIEDIKRRAEVGKQNYGTYLQVGNGRDSLLDAYEEAQDKALYLKQAILERDDLVMELEAAREEVAELKQGIASANSASQSYYDKILWYQSQVPECDRRMKAIGAAEKLEQLAGKFGGQFVGTRRYNTDELLEIAAQLRREAGE